MASKYWVGGAPAVAQVAQATVTGYDGGTTYKVAIGGVVVSVVGSVDANGTAVALVAALEASTHPYFQAVNWTAPGGGVVRGTAATAGCPFVFSTSVVGGAGTFGAYSVTTANAGPYSWDTAANWSDGVVPVNGDTVAFPSGAVNCLWGLDQSSVNLAVLRSLKAYTGYVGLNAQRFASNAAGTSYATWNGLDVPEYRTHYLTLDYVTAGDLGDSNGPVTGDGSGRFKLSCASGSTASTIVIHDTASQAAETGLGAVRLLGNVNTMDVFVKKAPGGVGIAADVPGETTTIRKVSISDRTAASQVILGAGVAITTWEQSGGNNVLRAAATVTTATVSGGALRTEGDFTLTTANVSGGELKANHIKTAAAAITTANVSGGLLDGTGSAQPRTWTTVNRSSQGRVKVNSTYLTMTNPPVCLDGMTIGPA